MTHAARRLAVLLIGSIAIGALGLGRCAVEASQSAVTRTTIAAEDARRMNAAVKALRSSDDRLIAYLSRHVVALANALAARPGRLYTVGPLTSRERDVVQLGDYLADHEDARGTIRLQVRIGWTDRDARIYVFSRATFVALLAALAKGPTLQVPLRQQQRELFLERTILDLNQQAGRVIPEREVFAALVQGFRDQHVGNRLLRVVQAMLDQKARYDLVPPGRLEDFERWGGEELLVPTEASDFQIIALRYGESRVDTRADHLLWSMLRFFAGENSDDWVVRTEARSRAGLGRDILQHLETQVVLTAIDAMLETLSVSPRAQRTVLGQFRAQGLVLAFLNEAPGVIRAKQASNRVSVSVRRGDAAALEGWLRREAERLQGG